MDEAEIEALYRRARTLGGTIARTIFKSASRADPREIHLAMAMAREMINRSMILTWEMTAEEVVELEANAQTAAKEIADHNIQSGDYRIEKGAL